VAAARIGSKEISESSTKNLNSGNAEPSSTYFIPNRNRLILGEKAPIVEGDDLIPYVDNERDCEAYFMASGPASSKNRGSKKSTISRPRRVSTGHG